MKTLMIPNSKLISTHDTLAHTVEWCGLSGRSYMLISEKLEHFTLAGKNLYVIAKGDKATWIGTANDIIDDHASRASFKAAVKTASAVLRLLEPTNDVQRLHIKWDLDAGHLASAPELAPAL